MKFLISTQELNSIIAKIQNIVPLKPTVPVLNFFLIEAYNDELILTATDLVAGIRCSIEAKVIEEGATALPARRLAQLMRELTTSEVEISSNRQEITTLISGSSRFKLKGISKEEYPTLPDLSHTHVFSIKQKELKDLLYRTSFAISKEDNRYALTGLLMQISNGVLQFVGTDGKRLSSAKQSIDVPQELTNHSIIPLKAVEEMSKNLTDEGDAKLTLMSDKIAIEIGQTLLLTKLLSGDYPDIQRIIPDNCAFAISLHREELITLLRQILLFTPDHFHSIRCTFEESEVTLSANSPDIGEGQVSMPVNYQGPKLEVAFNPGFFIDILRHCKNETVTLGLIDAYNPGVIIDGEIKQPLNDNSPLFIIMPMRLSEE